MEEDVLGYIESKFHQVKRANATNVNVACCFCNEPPEKRGRLYINVDPNADPPGLFMCHLCGERGAINKLRKHFGDPVIREEDSGATIGENFRRIMSAATDYFVERLGENEEAFKYLRYDRGLEFDAIEKHQLGWADGHLKEHLLAEGFALSDLIDSGLVTKSGRDFLYGHITIPYHVSGNVLSIRGKEIGGKYLTPPGHKARLFNSDCTWEDPERAVICEGEFDAMVIEQLGIPAVGVPGAGTWQDAWTPYVEDITRIYICFDPDDAGRTGAEKLSTKLGGRAKIVALPEDQPGNDVSDWIVGQGHTLEDFEFLLVRSRGGLLITARESYEEWLNVEGNPERVGLKLGYPLLDMQIKPGIMPGQVIVVTAKTNAGKTLFLINTFHRMMMEKPDIRILFLSLEQTRNEWFERARKIHRFYDLDASETDTVNLWQNRFLIIDKNRVAKEELISSLDQYEYEMGQKPDLVAIDYFGYFARGYKGESYDRSSQAIMDLKEIGKEYKVPFITPNQVNRGTQAGEKPGLSAGRDSGVVEETADLMMSLWTADQIHNRQQSERTGVVTVEVDKVRGTGAGAKIDMQLGPLTCVLVPKGDPEYSRAAEEYRLYKDGEHFDAVIERWRNGNR